jgi:hypothetical protein
MDPKQRDLQQDGQRTCDCEANELKHPVSRLGSVSVCVWMLLGNGEERGGKACKTCRHHHRNAGPEQPANQRLEPARLAVIHKNDFMVDQCRPNKPPSNQRPREQTEACAQSNDAAKAQ